MHSPDALLWKRDIWQRLLSGLIAREGKINSMHSMRHVQTTQPPYKFKCVTLSFCPLFLQKAFFRFEELCMCSLLRLLFAFERKIVLKCFRSFNSLGFLPSSSQKQYSQTKKNFADSAHEYVTSRLVDYASSSLGSWLFDKSRVG